MTHINEYYESKFQLVAEKLDKLEKIICKLALGHLLHEYAKDLSKFNVERICKVLAYEGDIDKAFDIMKENSDFDTE